MNVLDAVGGGAPTELALGKRGEGKADEKTALRSFEAYFLGELLRIATPKDSTGLFDGGQAGRMYREHFFQELARIIADNGGVGIAEGLEGQLSGTPDGEKETVGERMRADAKISRSE